VASGQRKKSTNGEFSVRLRLTRSKNSTDGDFFGLGGS